MNLPPAIFLLGPTASGKTDLAQRLVSESNLAIELISVDSAQVYRGLDIGTGKSGNSLHHHLVDIRDPADPYSVADFREDALALMDDITARGKVPLLVGGTMLYFKALKEGLAKLPEANPAIRSEIEQIAKNKGWEAVHRQLIEVDPASAARIRPGDPQRLQRALEVYQLTGVPMSFFHQMETEPCPYQLIELGLMPSDRAVLHERIEIRFRQMLAEGLVEEVRALYERGDLDPRLPAIRSVGYRQIWGYLEGEIAYDEMIEKALAATRQLAKRQITWMRGWMVLEILPCLPYPDYTRVLKSIEPAFI